MKKNWIMRVALIIVVLTLGTTCLLNSTFAKYVTKETAEDAARVAHWGYTAPTTLSLDVFNTSYGTSPYSAQSGDGTAIIAPGTSGSAQIKVLCVSGAPEIAYTFTVSTEGSSIDDDLKTHNNIKWRLDDNAWGDWETMLADIIALSGDASGTKKYEAGTIPELFNDTHTISWQWQGSNYYDIISAPKASTWNATLNSGSLVVNATIDDIPAIVDTLKPVASAWDKEWNGTTYTNYADAENAWKRINTTDNKFDASKYLCEWNGGAPLTYTAACAAYTAAGFAPVANDWMHKLSFTYGGIKYESTSYYISYADAKAAYEAIEAPIRNINNTTNYDLFGCHFTNFDEAWEAYNAAKPSGTTWSIEWNGKTYYTFASANAAYTALDPQVVVYNGTDYATLDLALAKIQESNPSATLADAARLCEVKNCEFTYNWNGDGEQTLATAWARYNSAEFKPNADTWKVTITKILDGKKYTLGTFATMAEADTAFNDALDALTNLQNASVHEWNGKDYSTYAAALKDYNDNYKDSEEAKIASNKSQNEIDSEMGNKALEDDGITVELSKLDSVEIVITMSATQDESYKG